MKNSKRMTTKTYGAICPDCGEFVDCGSTGDCVGLGATNGLGDTKCESCGCEFKVTK